MSILSECIPTTTVSEKHNLPWPNQIIRVKIKKRNVAYKKGKRSGNFQKYKKLRNEIIMEIRKSKREYLRKVSLGGSKKFWQAVKYIWKSSTSNIPTLTLDSTVAISNTEKAKLLNDTLVKNFNFDVEPLSY